MVAKFRYSNLLHSQLESFQAPVDQVAVEGAWDGSDGVLQEADSFGEVVVVGGDGAHDDVSVAVHVLRQRVVADVGTELERALQQTIRLKRFLEPNPTTDKTNKLTFLSS